MGFLAESVESTFWKRNFHILDTHGAGVSGHKPFNDGMYAVRKWLRP
jgi:hypothetical protein